MSIQSGDQPLAEPPAWSGDSLDTDSAPEEDGVDNRVEPPSWLPEGDAPETAVDGPAGVADSGLADGGLAGSDLADNGLADNGLAGSDLSNSGLADDPEPAGVTDEGDSYSFGHDSLYTYSGSGTQHGYTVPDPPGDLAGFGAESTRPAPPYPAQVSAPDGPGGVPGGVPGGTAAFAVAPPYNPKMKAARGGGRRANLVVSRVEPWSVMKFSFLMSLVGCVVLVVAVALLYFALSSLGVFDSLQRTLQGVTSSQNSAGTNLSSTISVGRVVGYTMLVGFVDVILITAISTVGAVIYNLVSHVGGGIEVTLKETD